MKKALCRCSGNGNHEPQNGDSRRTEYRQLSSDVAMIKIHWHPEERDSPTERRGYLHDEVVWIGFCTHPNGQVPVGVIWIVDGLTGDWRSTPRGGEYIHNVESGLDLVIRRLPDMRLAVGIWGDYSTKRRSLSTQEAVLTDEELSAMVRTFIVELAEEYLRWEFRCDFKPWWEEQLAKTTGSIPAVAVPPASGDRRALAFVSNMKIYWQPQKDEKPDLCADRYYGWIQVGFSENYMVTVRVGFLVDGLIEAWEKIAEAPEYTHAVECMVDLVVRRLPDAKLGVAIWGDYSTSLRFLCSEEVLVTADDYTAMVDSFVTEIASQFIRNEGTKVLLNKRLRQIFQDKQPAHGD